MKWRLGLDCLYASSLLPVIVAGILLGQQAYRHESIKLEQAAQHTARALSLGIDSELASLQGYLQIMAASPQLQSGELESFYRQSQQVLRGDVLLQSIELSNANGQILLSTQRPYPAQVAADPTHRSLLRQVFKSGRPGISDLYIDNYSNRSMVTLAAPIFRGERVSYVLAMGIPPARLGPMLKAQAVPAQWSVTLYDGNGLTLATNKNGARQGTERAPQDLAQRLAESAEGTFSSRAPDGGASFAAFSRSEKTGWTAVVTMHREVLERELQKSLILYLSAILLSSASALGLTLLLTRRMRHALHLLGNSLDAAAAGDPCATAQLQGPVEVIQLASQFNRMQLARLEARAELRLAASVFSESGQGIIIAGGDALIIDVNRAFTDLTGYQRDEVIGRNPRILSSGKHDAIFFREMFGALHASGRWQGQIWNRRKDGTLFAGLMTLNAVKDGAGVVSHYIALFNDVTQLNLQRERIERLAYYDPLTQLPNRRLLTDRLQQALLNAERQHSKLAVCCLDLDGFKPVNDVHGHEAGDLVLIEVAGRLGKALRPNDTAARLGGDEFVLLLTNIQNQQEYDAIFDRILQAIAAPIVLEGGATVRVTASIGMASYPCDGQDPDQLLRYGDKAMYRAKQAGHNCVRYYSAPPPASEQQ